MSARAAQQALRALANAKKAIVLQRFFKTGPGEYGEGDCFLGVTVPQTRSIAARFPDLDFTSIKILLISKFHEERLLALIVLVKRFRKADEKGRARVFKFYLAHTRYVNNWDLVDSSAHLIVGPFLEKKDRRLLYQLAKSNDLWKRRIAILSTLHFIRNGDFKDTLQLTRLLLRDPHDLIAKACGWMLREAGKKERKVLEDFLEEHRHQMPRTMLRYAIERFSPSRQKFYLRKSK